MATNSYLARQTHKPGAHMPPGFPEESRGFLAAGDNNAGLAKDTGLAMLYIIIGLSHVRGESGSRGGVAKSEQNESLPSRLQNTRHNFPRSQWPGITITWPGNLKLPPTARHLAHSGHRDLLSKGPRVNPWPLIG